MATNTSQKPQGKFKAGDDLRRRLLETANRLFRESGYENVSIRRIAEEVGCSQMAMYRHFPDKESLIRHLCNALYKQFTAGLASKFNNISDPKKRMRHALFYFVRLAAANPHHYRFTFLARISDQKTQRLRAATAEPTITYIRNSVSLALPPGSSEELIDERLHQILAVTHGVILMLITYPRAYRITRDVALMRLDSALAILLQSHSLHGVAE